MNIKSELMIGISTIIIILIITAFFFQKSSQKVASLKNVTITPSTYIKLLTESEIQNHSSDADCWIVLENRVYDVTAYISKHPGGERRILQFCGQDATDAFNTRGGEGSHSNDAVNLLNNFYIGDVRKSQIQQPSNENSNSLPIYRDDDDD